MINRKLFCFMTIEGLLLLLLGFCILILPKLTNMTFIVMTASAFIVYGIYKFIGGIINRSSFNHIFCEMILGIYITVIGILLLFVPKTNILWLMALIGVYFIFESIMSLSFAEEIRNVLKFSCIKYAAAIIMFLSGLFILVGIPEISFPAVSVLAGASYIVKGMAKRAIAIVNKDSYEIIEK